MIDIVRAKERYAEILVHHGLAVQKGQLVYIQGEPVQREFMRLVAEVAYAAGAKYVSLEYNDPFLSRTRIEKAEQDSLGFIPASLVARYREIVDTNAATLTLVGSELPEAFKGLDPVRVNTTRKARYQALKFFYDKGIDASEVHWSVAACPTEAWAERIFPELPSALALEEMWRHILQICRADQENALELWQQHNETLHARAKWLTELGIETLHFTGPGTDLRVGLSERAIFKGGTERSSQGVYFEPNIPTEECFTTPNYHLTEGMVRATRPFFVNGVLIEELEMEFRGGKIVDCTAKEGLDVFREYIASDEGAKRLGEVALVGIDSPIYQSGKVFQEILLDENAACHIAVGSAYKFCIKDGTSLSEKELQGVGCNESSVHTDIMISSERVSVKACLCSGKEISIISHGSWSRSDLP